MMMMMMMMMINSGVALWSIIPDAFTWTWIESRSRSRYYQAALAIHVAVEFISVSYVIEPVSGPSTLIRGIGDRAFPNPLTRS